MSGDENAPSAGKRDDERWRDFRFKVAEQFVEKLILGAVVLALGFAVNARLEDYKEEAGLRSGVTRTRIEKLAETAAAMGSAEHEVVDLATALDALERAERRRDPEDFIARKHASVDAEREAAKAAIRSFRAVLDQNRFWLSDACYRQIQEHVTSLVKTLRASAIDLDRLDETRPSVEDVFPELGTRAGACGAREPRNP